MYSWFKIFGCLPLFKIRTTEKSTTYYLFGIIPLVKIKIAKFNPYHNVWTEKIYQKCRHVGVNLRCGGKTLLSSNTSVGDNCSFNGCEIHGAGKVTFGNYVHSGVELLIIAQNHNYDHGQHIPYSPDDYVYKDIEIGDFVWIGSRVTILPGAKIGEGAVIQAGAVVREEIPPLAVAGGNPAKVFKYRDAEHFAELKRRQCFC